MTTIILRDGVAFKNVTLSIPAELKDRARDEGISLSATLTRVLQKDLDNLDQGGPP